MATILIADDHADDRLLYRAILEAEGHDVLEAADGSRLEGVAFRAVVQQLGDLLQNTGGMPIHVASTLKRDTWGGREKIELTIEDAADPRRQD